MDSVKLRVSRYDPESETSGWSEFTVPLQERTTVLDCLDHVRNHDDPSLGFRFACRVGMCGSCAMVVNGKERWTCRTLVRELRSERLTIEPLRRLDVIRDLAVDLQPFWEKYRRIQPAHTAKQKPPKRIDPRERLRIDPNIECISCGACYSSCSFVGFDPAYLGPHALNRAFTLVEDSRDGGRATHLQLVDNEHGCWKCHTQLNCTEVCPVGISPSAGIQVLKRAVVQNRVFSPSRRKFVFSAMGAAVAAVAAAVVVEPGKQWIPAGREADIPPDGVLPFVHNDTSLFLLRDAAGAIFALSQMCSHQGCPVDWNGQAKRFECSCHDGLFNPAGQPTSGPPKRSLQRIKTRVQSGIVHVLI